MFETFFLFRTTFNSTKNFRQNFVTWKLEIWSVLITTFLAWTFFQSTSKCLVDILKALQQHLQVIQVWKQVNCKWKKRQYSNGKTLSFLHRYVKFTLNFAAAFITKTVNKMFLPFHLLIFPLERILENWWPVRVTNYNSSCDEYLRYVHTGPFYAIICCIYGKQKMYY